MNEKIKILFFVDGLGAGGKERRLVELMKALRLNPAVEFELVLMSHNIHYDVVNKLDIRIHYLIRKTKKDFTVLPKLFKLCKIIKPDIIHCWDGMTAVYSVPVCKMLKISLVNGMVSNTPTQWNILNKNWIRAKITFPFSDYIVGNSKAGVEAYKAPAKNSLVIQNGFNFNRIKNIDVSKELLKSIAVDSKLVVGMVASFAKAKDYKTFMLAANLILDKRSDITFLAIGYNTESPELRKLIAKDRIRHFRFLGTKSDIESYISVMDICVLSTFTEGISNSILEYMALGKPVVATDGGGTSELLADKITGYLVNVSDPEDLRNKLMLLIDNKSLRIQMGEAGKQRILKEFSIEIMLNKYMSLYSKIKSQRIGTFKS